MERLIRAVAGVLFLVSAAGIGPLDENRMAQVQTAVDHEAVIDAPALYPLLEDAVAWKAGDETGAAIPDYETVLADPAAYRGQLFLIEGRLKRRRPVDRLSRPGPWDGRLEQWVVQIGLLGETAVIYLVDPPAEAKVDMRVRMPARFYMVMRDKVAQSDANETADFPVFVGKTAKVSAAGGSGGAGIFVALLIIMGLLYFIMRTKMKAKAVGPRRLRKSTTHDDREDEADDMSALPENPADALDALSRQNDQNEKND